LVAGALVERFHDALAFERGQIVAEARAGGVVGAARRSAFGSRTSPDESSTARSIAFFSSRTLPGQP